MSCRFSCFCTEEEVPTSGFGAPFPCILVLNLERESSKSCFKFHIEAQSWVWCEVLTLEDKAMSVVFDGSPLKAMQSSHTHTPQTALR